MSDDHRQGYFWRRAREARDLATMATDERVRLVHTEMAIRYEQRAAGKSLTLDGQPGPDETGE